MRMQHLELKNSFDDYLLTGDGLQGFFGRNHINFFRKNNFTYEEIIFKINHLKKKFLYLFSTLKKNSYKKIK